MAITEGVRSSIQNISRAQTQGITADELDRVKGKLLTPELAPMIPGEALELVGGSLHSSDLLRLSPSDEVLSQGGARMSVHLSQVLKKLEDKELIDLVSGSTLPPQVPQESQAYLRAAMNRISAMSSLVREQQQVMASIKGQLLGSQNG